MSTWTGQSPLHPLQARQRSNASSTAVKLTISPLIFNPAGGTPLKIQLNAATFQSRPITVKVAFRTVLYQSVLRTITVAAQPSGQVIVTWNGRADNGDWVVPSLYELTITATDSAGGSTVLKPLVTVRYE